MNNYKKAGTVIVVLFAAMLATACSEKTEKQTKNQETGTVVYYTWTDEKYYTEKTIEAFESEYPKIHIQVEYLADDLTAAEIREVIDAEDVDVIGAKSINDILILANEGKVENITSQVENSGIDVSNYGAMYNSVSINGDYYCLPTRRTTWILVYNRDIFDAEEIPYPEQMTWDEYVELAKSLTKGDGEDKQWGGYFVNWIYNFMAIQRREYLHDDDLTYSQESLQFLNQIYNVDLSHMDLETMEEVGWLEAFESGKVALMPQGEWFMEAILEDEKNGKSDVNWDLAPMPVPQEGEDGNTWGQYQLAAITSKSTNQEAAFKFLTYLCGKQGAEIYARNAILPAYIDEDIQENYEQAVGNHNVEVLFDSCQLQEEPAYVWYSQLKALFESEATLYLKGEQTIEETMENFVECRAEVFR